MNTSNIARMTYDKIERLVKIPAVLQKDRSVGEILASMRQDGKKWDQQHEHAKDHLDVMVGKATVIADNKRRIEEMIESQQRQLVKVNQEYEKFVENYVDSARSQFANTLANVDESTSNMALVQELVSSGSKRSRGFFEDDMSQLTTTSATSPNKRRLLQRIQNASEEELEEMLSVNDECRKSLDAQSKPSATKKGSNKNPPKDT